MVLRPHYRGCPARRNVITDAAWAAGYHVESQHRQVVAVDDLLAVLVAQRLQDAVGAPAAT